MTGARRWGLEWAHLDELAALLAPGPAVVISPDVQAHALEISATALRGRHSEHVSGVLARHARSPAYISTAVPELRVEPMELERLRCRLIGATE
jgi:hypothetical protein